jgi:hypothetical protein
MDLTYTLIPGGYELYRDGELWLSQPFAPGVPGFVPMTEAEAIEAAEAALVEYGPHDEQSND